MKKETIFVYGVALFIFALVFILLGSFSVSAGCVSPYDTADPVMNFNAWVNVNNTRDSNTGTYGYCQIGTSDYIVWYEDSYFNGIELVGMRLWGVEKAPGGDGDLYLQITVDGVSEGEVQFTRGQWSYFNFSKTYDYDAVINASWNNKLGRSNAQVMEVQLLFIDNRSSAVTGTPANTGCVIPRPVNVSIEYVTAWSCDHWVNISVTTNASGSWVEVFQVNDTDVSSSNEPVWYVDFYDMNDFDRRYYYNITFKYGGGSYYTEGESSKTVYIDTDTCPPSYPVVDGLTDADCWHMVSIFYGDYNNTRSKTYLAVWNVSDWSYQTWDTAVGNGIIHDGLFYWNYTTQQYDNITSISSGMGVWIYSYDDNYRWLTTTWYKDSYGWYNDTDTGSDILKYYNHSFIYRYTMNHYEESTLWFDNVIFPKHFKLNDTSMSNSGYHNFTILGFYVNVSWESWYNDSDVDTLETVLSLLEHNVTGGGVGCDYPYWINYTTDNVTISIKVNSCDSETLENASVNESAWIFQAGIVLEPETFLLVLFIVFFSAGYTERKRSGGVFLFMAGIILLGFSISTSLNFDNLLLIPILTPVAIFVMILGIRKWLYPVDGEKMKSEGK